MEILPLLLLGLSVVVGLTIPNGHSPSGPTFVTRYDLFDQSGPRKDSQNTISDGSPHLRPIADVFVAMNSASPTLGRAVAQMVPTASPLLEVMSTPVSPTPHFGGPGPVKVPSPALNSLLSPTSGVNDLGVGDNANANVTSSKHFVVLGTIAGGILFFTFCIFLIMSPSCNGSFCGWGNLKNTLRSKATEENIDQEKPPPDTASWVIIHSPPSLPKRSSLETVKDFRMSGTLATGDTVLDVVSALASPDEDERNPATSKFSMCSSEYPSSFCSSTTDLASNSSTVKAFPFSSHPSNIPVRPPRPPTADSPALSDSVYLAFSHSDQPYVIVQPQPLTEGDLQVGSGPESPRRLLTPNEFAALHTSDHLSQNEKRITPDSRHSRAKSAPSLGRLNRYSVVGSRFVPSKLFDGARKSRVTASRKSIYKSLKIVDEGGNLLEDIENDSDVQETMVRKVMKHRRSRSASGWAYPPKGRRTRKTFRLEE